MNKLFYILLSLLLLSCSVSNSDKMQDNDVSNAVASFVVPKSVPELTSVQNSLCEKITVFSFDCFADIMDKRRAEDVLFSPYSLAISLGMCGMGASGETRKQLYSVLGIAEYNQTEVDSFFNTLIGRTLLLDEDVVLSSANALFVDTGFPIKDEYIGELGRCYNAECYSLDFSSSKTGPFINSWLEKKTRGGITAMLDNPQAPLLLANALYFYAPWGIEMEKRTVSGTFNSSSGPKQANFFTTIHSFPYYENDVCKSISIPYGSGCYDMLIVLPKPGVELIEVATLSNYADLLCHMDQKVVTQVFIPEFSMNCSLKDIKELLVSKGVSIPFTYDADFSIMSSDPLYIQSIIQDACISVDRKGTSAASATVVLMDSTNGEDDVIPVFKADCPFLFMLREKDSGIIYFIGYKA